MPMQDLSEPGLLADLRPLLRAATPQDCHAAIAVAAQNIGARHACTIWAAEIAPAPQGDTTVWQNTPDAHALAQMFVQARQTPGRVTTFAQGCGLALPGGGEADASWIAVAADIIALPEGLESMMRDLADFAARPLQRLRRDEEHRLRRQRLSAPESASAAVPTDTHAKDKLSVDVITLDNMMRARSREERLRRETEAMMLGLRLLLGELSFGEKLEQLARHLARAIDCDDVRLVGLRPGDAPRLTMPGGVVLKETLLLRRILTAADSRAVTVLGADSHEAGFLRAALAVRDGAIVLVALPAPGERFYLICRAKSAVSAADEGIAERIALLLQQALVLQDDQARMVHTAKLSALGQMSTSIAHELRQPLNTISIAAQNLELLAERDTIDAGLLREKAARILGQVERACQVMDRMRRFGRKTAGDYRPSGLAAIVRGAGALMDKTLSESGTTLEIAVDDTIAVLADALEIEQVLVNLIQNAADAIHARGPHGCIRMYDQDDPGRAEMLRLVVEDNGPGFSPDVLRHALDAFFTTKPAGQGTGLGLSIAHAILREHGGRLLVGNSEENGTVTGGRITLVLRRAPPGASDAAS